VLGGATVKQLIELSGQHLSIRAIARKYLRAPRLPVAKPRPRRPSKVDPFRDHVRRRLAVRDHVRRRLAAGVENCLVLLRELIQVDRALARTLELAGLAPVCAGEGALLMPEELGLEQALRDRGAVNLDEWTTTARRDGMDGSGHQVFADAAFTPDQDRRIRIGDTRDDRPDGAHLGGFRRGMDSRVWDRPPAHTRVPFRRRGSQQPRVPSRSENRCYGSTGTSTRLSPVPTRTRRSIAAARPVGTVAR